MATKTLTDKIKRDGIFYCLLSLVCPHCNAWEGYTVYPRHEEGGDIQIKCETCGAVDTTPGELARWIN